MDVETDTVVAEWLAAMGWKWDAESKMWSTDCIDDAVMTQGAAMLVEMKSQAWDAAEPEGNIAEDGGYEEDLNSQDGGNCWPSGKERP